MKHQASFSLKDKSKNNKIVVCCNFDFAHLGLTPATLFHVATSVTHRHRSKHLHEGQVVQSIVSLTSSLRGQCVKCFSSV